MEELKPCPFCKGEAHYNRKQIQQGYIVVGYDCKQCGAAATVFTGPMTAEKNMKIQATEAWNRRAEPENKALTLEQLRQMNGEPVWLEDGSRRTSAARLDRYMVVDKTTHDGVYFQFYPYLYRFDQYGKTWLAYARKPEGSET